MALALRFDLAYKIGKIRSKGLPYLSRGVKRFFKTTNEVIDLYVLDIKNGLSRLPEDVKRKKLDGLGKTFEIKVLSADDRSYLEEFVDFGKSKAVLWDEYLEIIFKQSVCFLALLDKHIVAITCLAFGEFPFQNFDADFILGPTQTYRCESFVDREYRQRGIMALLWDYEASYALHKGYTHIIAAIRQDNKDSYEPTLKFGFKKYATIMFKERFFMQRHESIKIDDRNDRIISLRLQSGRILTI